MKQIILTFFLITLIFSSVEVKSQDQDNARKPYVPNITVSTPQAASLSKVGEIPIDISTGRMNYSIPIFEIKEGNFTMPINLSYNYSGLLLDETPGYAGVGWTFNIGGSILHTVNGLNDEGHEDDKKNIFNYINKLPPYNDMSTPEGRTIISNFLERVSNGITDGEPDKYTINIGNINSAFYLDKDNNPIFLKNEKYKISGYSHSSFTLTDDQGINYIFNLSQGAERITENDQYSYTTSFLITEINFPFTSNKITFEYGNPIQYYETSFSQSLIKTTNQFGNPNNNFTLRNNTVTTILNPVKLNKIITNNYTIELQYNNNPTEQAIAVISNLSIKDKFSKAVKSYDFNYSAWTGRRTNLLNVKYNGAITNEMEYDMSLPYPLTESNHDRVKKDLWGYYNREAQLVSASGIIDSYNNPKLKPHFESTKIGALKKITYQTKGYSLIEYEPNVVYMGGYNFPYESDALVTTQGFGVSTDPKQINSRDTLTLKITQVPIELVPKYQFTNGFEMEGEHDRVGKINFYENGELRITAQQYWGRNLGTWTPAQRTFMFANSDDIIKITKPGTYFLEAISDQGITAKLSVLLKDTPRRFNQTVGGLRVKQIKNCDFNGECITTVYNYSEDGKSTGVMLQKPKFDSGETVQDNRDCRQGSYVRQDYYNFTSIYPLSNYRGSPVLYKKVEKTDFGKNGNNQLVSNGKTIFTYHGKEVVNSLQDEESYFTIGLLDTKLVKDQAGATVSKQKNSYLNREKTDVPKFVYSFECKAIYERRGQPSGGSSTGGGCGLSYPRPMNDFLLTQFRHEAKNYLLEKEEYTNYYHGDSLTQATVYNYNLNSGFLKSQTSINSKSETLETKYFYPIDDEMASEPFRNQLITKNIIKAPLVIQNYNNQKLSEQKTEYGNDAATVNLLLPKHVYTNKGPTEIDKIIDKKITYDKYDEKGNVLQYTLEKGTPISIIWGYNKTQPIAKIENATYDQIANYESNLQILSNADDDNCISADCKEQILRNALNSLRNSLTQSMISTYTYNPLVGVTSVTDPKGIPTYYEYDPLGRLKFVKDKDLNVIQKYCYNYKGQQTDCSDNTSTSVIVYKSAGRSGTFTKNNCGPGGVASSVTFSLPAGAVSSTISQEDVDNKETEMFNNQGQAYVNSYGYCTYTSIARTGLFTKNDCTVGGVTSAINYNQLAGAVISTISQEDADSKGLIKFNIDGQSYANANNTCTYSSVARSGSFAKNNCTVGGVGSVINYNQEAAAVISTTSQADADTKALDLFNTNGQANANANGICTYSSSARNGSFTKNDCAAGGVPSSVAYNQLVGAVVSTSSQADADSKGLEKFNTEGQIYANANAICLFNNATKTVWLVKNDCTIDGVPSGVWYTVPAGRYSSNDSQVDADNKAQLDINTLGQNYANSTAECIFQSKAYSRSFQKHNCGVGGIGSYHDYSQPQGAVTLNTSQADVDALALTKFNNDGQAYANTHGTCVFYNAEKSITAKKDDCPKGKYGSEATYTVPYGKYSSSISKADADQLAQNDINANHRAYVNSVGTCSSETYDVFVVDAEESQRKFWVTVTSSSSNHPERTVRATFYYSYAVGQKINSGYWSSTLILPANVTSKTFTLSLSFLGYPEVSSFTVN